jgi:hypothetical protein
MNQTSFFTFFRFILHPSPSPADLPAGEKPAEGLRTVAGS